VDRLFLDANVPFSAAYRPDSGLRRLWRLPDVQFVTSEYAAEEARVNLADDAQRQRLKKLLQETVIVTAMPAATLPDDLDLPEKDRPILLAAIEARATHLLTGNRLHFGKHFGRAIGGVRVSPPGDYLRLRGRTQRGRR
jgi:predicted nucleic acid-binding protein